MFKLLDKISFHLVIFGSLTLGLTPFIPEPHLFEKLRMLFHGVLIAPVDIGDLVMHGVFPMLLIAKSIRHFAR
jgi:hypothetical protein